MVDFELLKRQAFQVGQRGVAGTKIVQRKAQPQVAQLVHFGDGGFKVAQDDALGQLYLEAAALSYVKMAKDIMGGFLDAIDEGEVKPKKGKKKP